MATMPKTYRFTAPLERMNERFAWYYIEFPHDVGKEFGTRGNVRVKGTFNGVPVDRALMPAKSGSHVLILGGELRRAAKVERMGDLEEVELWRNEAPWKLDFIPEMKTAWEKLNPGMRRSMCYWVASAKTTATRAKRVTELLRRFETGFFQVGKGPTQGS